MRRTFFVSLLLVATSAFAQSGPVPLPRSSPAPDAVLSQEKLFWTSYVAGDTKTLDTLLAPDFTNVEQEIWTRGQVLDFVKMFFSQCTLAPVRIEDPHVTFLTPEIATVVYHATESPTCGSRTMSGETNISTVWVLRNGHWQMHLHTEYAVPPKS